VGVLFFSGTVEKFIPAKKGKSHILRIISEIDNFDSKDTGTNIAEALKYFNNVNKKKSIAFLISDFMTSVDFKKELTVAGKRHDLIGLQIYDIRERELENIGTVLIKDAESGTEFFADTSNQKLRDQIKKNFDLRQKNTKELFGKCGSQFKAMDTTANYVKELMQLFKEREIRR
jgi:uncharacterized protein (DUF58 family)